MSIIDNTIAGQMPAFDPATPLMQAAKIQEAQTAQRAAHFKQIQTEIGSEARGLTPFVNTPEFPARWAEMTDRLAQKGLVNPQLHAQWRNAPSPLLLKQMIAQTEDPTLSFRKDEAARDQKNTDRSFGLQKTNADRTYGLASRAADRADEGPVEETNQRIEAAKVAGLDPTTPQGRTFALTGKVPESDTSLLAAVEQRKSVAQGLGITPESPAYNAFIATGKMPREDAQPLTAGDKEAIRTADDAVVSNLSAIESLKRAKVLSKQAFTGLAAGGRGYAASFLGESSDMGKAGIATENLTNEVMTNALGQLKNIFGGNPTEGERKIMLEMQGSVSKSDAVRQEIYNRAIGLAQKKLDFNQKRADELRGGTYYKKPGDKTASGPTGDTTQIPPAAIEALKANPQLKADFEAKYGAGTAGVVLR